MFFSISLLNMDSQNSLVSLPICNSIAYKSLKPSKSKPRITKVVSFFTLPSSFTSEVYASMKIPITSVGNSLLAHALKSSRY